MNINYTHTSTANWPNGKALDYESRDCRFDPCVGHLQKSLTCLSVWPHNINLVLEKPHFDLRF